MTMKRRSWEPPKKTLMDRLVYMGIGIFSGGLLGVLTVFSFCWYVDLVLIGLAGTVVFAVAMGIWGFFATDEMVKRLGYWWEDFMGRL